MAAHSGNALRWEPPADGLWTLEVVHFPRPISALVAEVFPTSVASSVTGTFEQVGLPFGAMRFAVVNNRLYQSLELIDDTAALTAREHQAATMFAERGWREHHRRWQEETKPARIGANAALQSVSLSALTDEELDTHLAAACANLSAGISDHAGVMPVAHVVVGDLVSQATAWGVSDTELLGLLHVDPEVGRPQDDLAALAHRCAGLDGLETIDDVRRAGPDLAEQLDRYLDTHGWRLVTGFDVDARCLVEMPQVLLCAIRARHRRVQFDAASTTPDRSVRARLRPDQVEDFDARLADARAICDIRDDNEGLTLLWPAGLVRRALLEIEQRLRRRDAAWELRDLTVLQRHEISDVLAGASRPAREIERRHRERAAAADAPAELGSVADAPSPVWPPCVTRAAAALIAYEAVAAGTSGGLQADGILAGTGIGQGSMEGRACVVASPDDALDRLEPGDVVVAACTNSAYDVVLSAAGALVLEEGGPYTHGAILARELGIPAVVGARGATTAITDGSFVRVDALAGTIEVIGRPSAAVAESGGPR